MDTSRNDDFGSVATNGGTTGPVTTNGGSNAGVAASNSGSVSDGAASRRFEVNYNDAGSGGAKVNIGMGVGELNTEPTSSGVNVAIDDRANLSGAVSSNSVATAVDQTELNVDKLNVDKGGFSSFGNVGNGNVDSFEASENATTGSGAIGDATGVAANITIDEATNGTSSIFSNSTTSMGFGSNDVVLGQQKKKKTGLIIGIAIAVVCVAVGFVLFFTLGLSAMDPKTGDNIKAKNYREAFNIYANYFMFGEKSKKEVDWEAANDEGFVSYYRRVVDYPFEVEGIVSGEKTIGGEIEQMRVYYDRFQEIYSSWNKRSESMVLAIEEYGNKVDLMSEYYNVGLPLRMFVLEEYAKGGFDAAVEYVEQLSGAYEGVGVLDGDNIADMVMEYGNNQIFMIEIYSQAGCLKEGEIDYACVSQKEDLGDTKFIQEASKEYNAISAIVENTDKGMENKLFVVKRDLELEGSNDTSNERNTSNNA